MKKLIVLMLAAAMLLSGCSDKESRLQPGRVDNMTAIIKLPNGEVIEGCPDHAIRYSEGSVSVQIEGVKYSVHSANVAFVEVTE